MEISVGRGEGGGRSKKYHATRTVQYKVLESLVQVGIGSRPPCRPAVGHDAGNDGNDGNEKLR